ncbi:electron transfer flavoprotein subunit beta/FixA family protein [Archaeoglobus veneficus]|uniref:Electron transfer flavoprotein alpha/beta-subunit n=1 Tax=Archaeoglobus veneficus (strain DSM 11195 / SNP6) TaxID=693661 RepID=F2KPN7_ARCVS|nr:electron transfer flavoprotein subunit alpha [Archaeoglobus veneficus]AEA47565.1 Electron transfer flavoprotein alpha/beta-subunit [Archaeoglobus veneficus SNP6]
MKICAILRLVPDLVEEIEISETEITPFAYIANERDEHAVEEALVLKEKSGATVDVLGIVDEDTETEIDEPLAMAYAKGADNLIKAILSRSTYRRIEVAKGLAEFLKDKEYDVIMVGIQAIDAFAGTLGGMLARCMGIPYIGGVVEADVQDGNLVVKKELGGGLLGEYKVSLPAVVGVVSAERPLKFVPFAKLRQAMKKAEIEEVEIEVPELEGVEVLRYYEPPKPEITLLEGEPEEIADKLVEVLKELSVL